MLSWIGSVETNRIDLEYWRKVMSANMAMLTDELLLDALAGIPPEVLLRGGSNVVEGTIVFLDAALPTALDDHRS